MARVTRSQKILVAEDNPALVSQKCEASLPTTTALAEIPGASNTMPPIEEDTFNIDASLKTLKAAYRSAIGGKKNKKGKNRKQDIEDSGAQSPGVLQEVEGSLKPEPIPAESKGHLKEAQSSLTDSKNSVDSEQLLLQLQGSEEKKSNLNLRVKENDGQITRTSRRLAAKQVDEIPGPVITEPVVVVDRTLQTAVREPVGVNQDIHRTTGGATVDENESMKYLIEKHTFIGTPKSPVKTLEEIEKSCGTEVAANSARNDSEDSFIEQIICRSPAKPVSRIEDSVEALDRFEEAYEALDQAVLAEQLASPTKLRRQASKQGLDTSSRPRGNQSSVTTISRTNSVTRQAPSPKPQPKSGHATMRVKSTAAKVPTLKRATSLTFKPASQASPKQHVKVEETKKVPPRRPLSLLPPKESSKSVKPATIPTKFKLPGEILARKVKEQREARLAAREASEEALNAGAVAVGPRTKSSKAPTKPAFELPGEAISRRKKEAREAQLKTQEEEERKRREFKARPIRNSVTLVPRDTVASRARQSKAGVDTIEDGSLSISKRSSNVGAHRPSIVQLNAIANSSAPRAPGPGKARGSTNSTHHNGLGTTSVTGQRVVSSLDLQAQRQRAKEIYNRDTKTADEIEREKREREAAAKRAREQAAERGRQASREWAEKQRMKKLAEGDKGLGAGYGPGGQMGLKG
ncbi:hypothetical protein B0O99DRAFT_691680 [Bisporella sp. PMI_857]|nr:hypothetical protein B0O99DRAFT_691680 [Bisporella sp. PMI_857]